MTGSTPAPRTIGERLRLAVAWKKMQIAEWAHACLATLDAPARIGLRWPRPMRRPWERAQLRVMSYGGGIGDELMCAAVLREVRRLNPDCHLTMISRFPDFFRKQPHIDEVKSYQEGDEETCHVLRYGPPAPPKRALATMMGECIGLSVRFEKLEPPVIEPSEEIRRTIEAIERPLVVIQPKSSRWTPNKNWPADRWRTLIQNLIADFSIVEVGTEKLFGDSEFGPGFHTFAGTTTLDDFAYIISQASVFVGPSSGGMHFANAFGRRAVIIIGGYEGPEGYDYPHRVFYSPVPCAPCWLGKQCPHQLRCHAAIEPAQVAAAVREQLSATEGAR